MPRKKMDPSKMCRDLNPTQQKCKDGRPVNYYDPNSGKNYVDPDLGCDIVTLYVTCGLGYSAIRKILNLNGDNTIENVVRQHMLGRKNIKHVGVLRCKSLRPISDINVLIIKDLAEKYKSIDNPDVQEMIETRWWYDDPVSKKLDDGKCPNCGRVVSEIENCKYCPECGEPLFDEDADDNC